MIIENLKKEGLKLLDMHSHTRYSDGSQTYIESIKKAKSLGLGVCITDHNEIKGSLAIKNDLFTLFGAEITTKEFIDILIYSSSSKNLLEFYKKYIEKSRFKEFGFRFHRTSIHIEELLDHSKEYNLLTILPHPNAHHPKNSFKFLMKNKKYSELIKNIDAIEVFNSMMSKKANQNAIKWALEINKPIVASSDAHRIEYLGQGLTVAYAETKDDFITQIIKNKSMIFGKELKGIPRKLEELSIISKNIKLF